MSARAARPIDDELLEAVGQGDPEAIASLYARFGPKMVAFARRYVDVGTAEDVVVSLLGQWLERPPRISSADRIGAFLASSIYHATIDWVRHDRVQQGQTPRPSRAEAAPDRRRAGPVVQASSEDTRDALRNRLDGALHQLSPGDRLLLESHYGHALTAEECMESLGISRDVFHQRLHRARVHLARLLSVEGANT